MVHCDKRPSSRERPHKGGLLIIDSRPVQNDVDDISFRIIISNYCSTCKWSLMVHKGIQMDETQEKRETRDTLSCKLHTLKSKVTRRCPMKREECLLCYATCESKSTSFSCSYSYSTSTSWSCSYLTSISCLLLHSTFCRRLGTVISGNITLCKRRIL